MHLMMHSIEDEKTVKCMVNNAQIVYIKHGKLLMQKNDIIRGCANDQKGFGKKGSIMQPMHIN